MTPDTAVALEALRYAWSDLEAARLHADSAADHLTGARQSRAAELSSMIADALAFVSRLHFVVQADLRSEEAQS
jgi:hypothetical protein